MKSALSDPIRRFLASRTFAVVGVSRDTEKYGRKVYEALRASGREPWGVNPRVQSLAGRPVYPSLSALPEAPEAVSVVVPPEATERVVAEAARLGVKRLWMQPGAESEAAVAAARAAGIEAIAGGPCLLVALAAERSGPAGGEAHDAR